MKLDAKEKGRIQRLLLELPALSDQRVSQIMGCDPKLVNEIRREMKSAGELPQVDVDEGLVDDI